jgi:hypothetical protein
MTPRERKDMRWSITAFAMVLIVIVAGLFGAWR